MKQIHFIINPIAGKGGNTIDVNLITKYFPKNEYVVTLKYTEYSKHAVQLTQSSIIEKANIIVACGGDGTINEVATCLVNSTIILGIIAIGSGNGLASNLKIPKNIDKALQIIKNQQSFKIDVGKINDNYFFSNMGIGFDAEVIFNYEKTNSRGLITYLKASLRSFRTYKYIPYKYTIDAVEKSISPLLFFISNSNEMGNNVTFTPKASLQDGLLDLVIVPKLNKLKMVYFGILLLFQKHFVLNEVTYKQLDNLIIKAQDLNNIKLQIDGEHFIFNTNELKISILKKALTVCSRF